jgi:hypothetical protein
MEFNSLTITVLLIITAIFLGILARRRSKDRVLNNFDKSPVSIEKIDGKIIASGILKVKTTGLELVYPQEEKEKEGFTLNSFLIYKYEFPQIQAIIRHHESMGLKDKRIREKKIKIAYRPSIFRLIIRKIRNFFNALKDSLLDILNISFTYFAGKKSTILLQHDKYVKSMNSELLESFGLSHEPLLEPYLGHYVVFELIKYDKKIKLSGILQDYTKEFLEFTDVNYIIQGDTIATKVDLIVPQKLAIVRHLSDKLPYYFPLIDNIVYYKKRSQESPIIKNDDYVL